MWGGMGEGGGSSEKNKENKGQKPNNPFSHMWRPHFSQMSKNKAPTVRSSSDQIVMRSAISEAARMWRPSGLHRAYASPTGRLIGGGGGSFRGRVLFFSPGVLHWGCFIGGASLGTGH